MRAVLGIGIAVGGVALLAYVVYGVRLQALGNGALLQQVGASVASGAASAGASAQTTSTGGTQ